MAPLDLIVDGHFRSEKIGRVVVFSRRFDPRWYFVRSAEEEVKLRSVLKTFYIAQFLILFLGYLVAYGLSMEIAYRVGRPAAHLVRSGGILLALSLLVVGIPSWLLRRSYKKTFLNFVSGQEATGISNVDVGSGGQLLAVIVGLIGLIVVTALGALFLMRET